MFHNYDYMSLFLSCFNVRVCLISLFQWISSIYDRFHLPSLNKLSEEDQVLTSIACIPKYHFLVA